MGRIIQKGLWLALAAVVALVQHFRGDKHDPAPTPVRAETLAPPPSPGSHRLPIPIAAPRLIRQTKSSLRACHLRGRVTNADEDVSLDLFRKAVRSNELVAASESAELVADGSFDYELPPGDYFVFAHDEEQSSSLAGPFSLGIGEEVSEVELTLEGNARVEGLVVDREGDPTTATIDVVVGEGAWKIHRSREVDSDGAFDLGELPYERLLLSALNAETGRRARMALAAPEVGLVVRLGEPAPALTVHVIDAQGASAEDARVVVRVLGIDDNHLESVCVSDERGTCVAYPRGDRIRVAVDSTNGIADPIDLDFNGDRELEIKLRAGATLRGRLVMPDGSAAQGQIRFFCEDRGKEFFAGTSLDDHGAFELTKVVAGHYLLSTMQRLEHSDFASGVIADLELAEDESRDLGDIRLVPDGSIRGVVRDELGQPIAGAMIGNFTGSEDSLDVEADDQGRFELHALFGGQRLRAYAAGRHSDIVVAHVGDANVVLTLSLRGEIVGVVHGLPVEDAWLRCGDYWHPLDDDGLIQMSCMVGATLEVAAGAETHRYAVSVDPDNASYVELNW